MSAVSDLAIIIPAYQPDEALIPLVAEIEKDGYGKIFVINDGSRAEKKEIYFALAKIPRVEVLTHAINMGKGAALKTAFNHVLVNYPAYAGVVTVDADGQHLPRDVRAVALSLLKNKNSLIMGARTFHSDVPLRSQFGNILTRNIFHFLMGKKLQDTQTGLRGIPLKFLPELLRIKSSRYEFELDMLVQATSQKISILEVPIETVYIEGNKSSHFNPLLDSFRIYFVFARFLFVSLFTFLVDFVSFTITYSSTHNVLMSVASGRIIALSVSMVGAKLFVFKSRENLKQIAPKFIALWMVLFGVSYVLMAWLVDRLHFNVYASRILVDSSLFVFNFLIQRDFIFSEKEEDA